MAVLANPDVSGCGNLNKLYKPYELNKLVRVVPGPISSWRRNLNKPYKLYELNKLDRVVPGPISSWRGNLLHQRPTRIAHSPLDSRNDAV